MSKIVNIIAEIGNGPNNMAWVEATWQEGMKAMCQGKMARVEHGCKQGPAVYEYKRTSDGYFKAFNRKTGTFMDQHLDADDIMEAKWWVEYTPTSETIRKANPVFIKYGRGNGKESMRKQMERIEEAMKTGIIGIDWGTPVPWKEFTQDTQKPHIKKAERPPLGIMPKYIHQEQRLQEIKEAMARYEAAGKEIPKRWREEMLELVSNLNERNNKGE